MNKIKRAFEPITANEHLKTQLKQELKNGSIKKKRTPFLKLAMTGFVCVLVIAFMFEKNQQVVDAAYLTFEGQVQITLTIDQENIVTEIVGLNEEGKYVVDSVDITGMEYTQAINEIVNCQAYKKYQLDQTSFNARCHDENRKDELVKNANQACHRRQNRHHRQ